MCALAIVLALPAWAQGLGGGPPEASQACRGKSQGAACSFTTPRGSLGGTRGAPPRQSQLLCMPRGGPPQGRPQRGGGGRKGADIVARDPGAKTVTSKVPDTQQGSCFNTNARVPCPTEGTPYYGQDANYGGPEPNYVDKGDGTIGDAITGLQWQKAHNAKRLNYPDAKRACANLTLGGASDWRLPNIKELQSVVDYTKSDPALDQRFLKQSDKKSWFWSSTTHGDNISMASYVCFGKCTSKDGVDTHGAGAQRSDPKTGDPSRWPSLGGQEDEVRIYSLARCVR